MILVTGATGHLGRSVVQQLLECVPAHCLAVSVRDPANAEDLTGRGISVRAGDFGDRESLKAAFAGMDRVLVVSANALGEQALSLHRNAITAAADAGVDRLFYTSHMGAKVGSAFSPTDQHARTERELAASGIEFTALRHGFYAESCLVILGEALKTGELRVPEDGPVSWTSRDDLAAADAALLAGNAIFDGPTPPLTATEALTMAEVAALASEVTGRSIKHVVVADDEWRDAKLAAGVPPLYADLQLGIFQAARAGDFALTSPALGELIGRSPLNLRTVLARSMTG